MRYEVILGSAVVAALISGFVAIYNSKREKDLHYITDDRRQWRSEIREITEGLIGSTYEDTINSMVKIKVRINAFGMNKMKKTYLYDAHIWELMDEIEHSNMSDKDIEKKQAQMVEYLSLLLKYDWERTKKEVKGHVVSAVSWLLVILASTCCVGTVFMYYGQESIQVFDYVVIAGIVIGAILLLNVGKVFLERKVFDEHLCGQLDDDIYCKVYWRFFWCECASIVLTFGVLIIGSIIMKLMFKLVAGNAEAEIGIEFASMAYCVGVSLGFFASSVETDLCNKYTIAINEVRKKYSDGC